MPTRLFKELRAESTAPWVVNWRRATPLWQCDVCMMTFQDGDAGRAAAERCERGHVPTLEIEEAFERTTAAPIRLVCYLGATDDQVAWGGCDDPRPLLRVGAWYALAGRDVHSWHTKVRLSAFPGKAFNSVSFEDVPPQDEEEVDVGRVEGKLSESKEVSLGDRVRDRVTGLTGIAMSKTRYLFGCDRVAVQPTELKDGRPVDAFHVDEPQLEVVKRGAVAADLRPSLEKTGGDRPAPAAREVPRR